MIGRQVMPNRYPEIDIQDIFSKARNIAARLAMGVAHCPVRTWSGSASDLDVQPATDVPRAVHGGVRQ